AAQAAYYIYFGQERKLSGNADELEGSYLGPEVSDADVKLISKKYKAPFKYFENVDELCTEVAKYIDEGAAIGWVQGRMEFGPRALGARSIIGDARNPEMQKKLNLKIKYRESFRPFAPSVMIEDTKTYFDQEGNSPYMLLVQPVVESRRKKLPEGFNGFNLKDKLYYLRSDIPAVTHIDFSARIQTVHKETNPRYWKLIDAFKKRTGYGVIVNTSFNVRGEPIVCTPEDAYRCFMRTEMDYLVVGNFVFTKTQQPEWKSTDNWKEEFVLD
ncbi:MAG: carbamoyltransferase C-terminal domain-containing protein, partial [Bacteroidia bacterium]